MVSLVADIRQDATSPLLTQGMPPPQYSGIDRLGVEPTNTSKMSPIRADGKPDWNALFSVEASRVPSFVLARQSDESAASILLNNLSISATMRRCSDDGGSGIGNSDSFVRLIEARFVVCF